MPVSWAHCRKMGRRSRSRPNRRVGLDTMASSLHEWRDRTLTGDLMTTSAVSVLPGPYRAPDAQPALQRAPRPGASSVHAVDGRSRIAGLHQAGSSRIRQPRTKPDAPVEAVLLNTAGGMTGGDRFETEVSVGPGAAAADHVPGGRAHLPSFLGDGAGRCTTHGRGRWTPVLAAAGDHRLQPLGALPEPYSRCRRRGDAARPRGRGARAHGDGREPHQHRHDRRLAHPPRRPASASPTRPGLKATPLP